MQSKTVIKVDLARSSYVPLVEAIQGDGATRCVSVQLLDNGVPWLPPEKTDIAVVYTQPGGKKGLYNKLPDGSSAISISGSTVTAILAPNMLSVAGEVHAALVFSNNQLDQLSSFPFSIMVVKNQFAGAQQSEDYIRLQWLEDKLEERIAQLISTEECARAGVAAQEATIAAAAAQEQAAVAGNAAASASTAAAAAQAVVDGIVPEVEQLRSDLTGITPDDAAVDGKPWTSKRIIDTLCPPFSETGNPAQCYPVEGYPLCVNIRIAPIQEGEGDPSPENVRPITGTVAVQIVHSNDAGESNTYDIALPETVYGGTLDLQTGLLTVDRHIYTLTGDETFVLNGDGSIRCSVEVVKLPANKYAEAIYSHYVTGTMFVGDGMLSVKYQGKLLLSFNKRLVSSMGYTVESLKAYLKTQYDGGTPVQACYCLDEPYEIQLTPQQITALSGVNTIYTDADGVIVTGAEDPKHTITELKNAILSLGGNI